MNRVLAVVTDRAHARFFDVGASEAMELTSLHSPAGRGGRHRAATQVRTALERATQG